MHVLTRELEQLGAGHEMFTMASGWEEATQSVSKKVNLGGKYVEYGSTFRKALQKAGKLKGLLWALYPDLHERFGTHANFRAKGTPIRDDGRHPHPGKFFCSPLESEVHVPAPARWSGSSFTQHQLQHYDATCSQTLTKTQCDEAYSDWLTWVNYSPRDHSLPPDEWTGSCPEEAPEPKRSKRSKSV